MLKSHICDIIIYRPQKGKYSEFVDLISNLAVSLNIALTVGDFIHSDKSEAPLRVSAVSALYSVGVHQNVNGPSHNGGHTLNLNLIFRLNIVTVSLTASSII